MSLEEYLLRQQTATAAFEASATHEGILFEKEQKVEYTLGFVHFTETNRFLIGYSTMDRTTQYLMISKHVFDEMMISHTP